MTDPFSLGFYGHRFCNCKVVSVWDCLSTDHELAKFKVTLTLSLFLSLSRENVVTNAVSLAKASALRMTYFSPTQDSVDRRFTITNADVGDRHP